MALFEEDQISDYLIEKRSKDREYLKRMEQATDDEVRFWEHLRIERERIQALIDKYKEDFEKAKANLEKALELMDSNDLGYFDVLAEVFVGLQKIKRPGRLEIADMRPTLYTPCKEKLENVKTIINFIKRSQEILDELKARLLAIIPS